MLKLAIVLAVVAVSCVYAENKYLLYTKNNPLTPEVIQARGAVPTFNTRTDTIVLIHGHNGGPRDAFNVLIGYEIARLPESYNVIVVDWEAYALLSYAIASSRVSEVAYELAEFLRWWASVTPPLDLNRLHLVGFGLGAHIAGIASRGLHGNAGIPGRITGLDPSGSGWGSNSLRLRADDAQYVEVLHTDGAGPLANGNGIVLGQINFFVNAGSNQPGCFSHSCSHNRAYEVFAATLSNFNLVGYPCNSLTQNNLNRCRGNSLRMGGTDIIKRGDSSIYRGDTGRRFPF